MYRAFITVNILRAVDYFVKIFFNVSLICLKCGYDFFKFWVCFNGVCLKAFYLCKLHVSAVVLVSLLYISALETRKSL